MISQERLQLAKSFARREDGSMAVLTLFLFVALLFFAGLAIDTNNAIQSRTQLQGAADAAGHAALYNYYLSGEDTAKTKAVEIAEMNMPTSAYGEILATADIEFGDWDNVDRTFTTTGSKKTAARVTTRRLESRSNAVSTFLMTLVGFDNYELNTVSVWDMEDGFCPPRSPDKKRGEGFFSGGVVDMQTSNGFKDGFCIHGDSGVKVSTQNTYDLGVIVSHPTDAVLQGPGENLQELYDYNTGLQQAHNIHSYDLDPFFNNIEQNAATLYANPYSSVTPSYITDKSGSVGGAYEITITNAGGKNATTTTINMDSLVPNAVNIVKCKNSNVAVKSDAVISNVVIVTDCDVKFNSGSALENAVLLTTSTNKTASISAPSGARFGATDYCSNGGDGTVVITHGSVNLAADFQAHGLNMIALDQIHKIAANANGLEGINIMSKGDIDVTSQSSFGFCANGPPQPFIIPYFRMVM